MVPTGGGHLQRELCLLLAHDVGQVERRCRFTHHVGRRVIGRQQHGASGQHIGQVGQVADTPDGHPGHQTGLADL